MALGRITVFVPGTAILASPVNGEFNNILNNPITLISPTTGPINFNLQAHTNLLPSAVSATSGAAADVLTITAGVTVWKAPASAGTPIGSRVSGLIGNSTTPGQLSSWAIGGFAVTQTTGSTGSFFFKSTAGFTIDAGSAQTGTTSGGRDQASTFSNAGQWTHFYLITTGANSTTPVGIVSLVAPPTGPALPSSYSAWTYLNSMYYTTGSQYQSQIFLGAKGYYYQAGSTTQQLVTSAGTQAAGNPAHSVTYSTCIPPATVCPMFDLSFHIEAVAAAEPVSIWLASTSDSTFHRTIQSGTGTPDLTLLMPNLVSGSFLFGLTATARFVIAYAKSYTVSNGDN